MLQRLQQVNRMRGLLVGFALGTADCSCVRLLALT
jgi:hypothetical protein